MRGVRAYFGAIAGAAMAVAGMDYRQAAADTLEWALVEAYQNNPSLNAQRAALRATDENVPQALSGYRPKLSITTNGGAEYQETVSQIANFSGAQTFYLRSLLSWSEKHNADKDILSLRNSVLSALSSDSWAVI